MTGFLYQFAILGKDEQDLLPFRQAIVQIRGCSFVYMTATFVQAHQHDHDHDHDHISSTSYFEQFAKILMFDKVYQSCELLLSSERWMRWLIEHPERCVIIPNFHNGAYEPHGSIDIIRRIFARTGSQETVYELRNFILKHVHVNAETLIISNEGYSILKDVDVLLRWITNSKAFTTKQIDEFHQYIDSHVNVCNVVFVETDLLHSSPPMVRIPEGVCTFLLANVDRIVYTNPQSCVLHKTPYSLHMFQRNGCYIGFTSLPPDSFVPYQKHSFESKRPNSFLHMAGLSPYKQTDIVLHSFVHLRRSTDFQGVLHVSCYDNVTNVVQEIMKFYNITWLHSNPLVLDEFGFRPTTLPGLFILYDRFDDQVKQDLMKSTQFLIQPSVIEGYGHVIHEAHYYDCVIITQQTPYTANTMVNNVNCLLIPFDTYTHSLLIRTGKDSVIATAPNALRFYYNNINDVIQVFLLAANVCKDTSRIQRMLQWSRYLHFEQMKSCFRNVSKYFHVKDLKDVIHESWNAIPSHETTFLMQTMYESKLSFRLPTVRTAINAMFNKKSSHFYILEFGCGYSKENPDYFRHGITHIWDDFVKVYGGSVYSFDDDMQHFMNATLYTSAQTIPLQDLCSEATLASIPLDLIDLVYISCAPHMPLSRSMQENVAQQRLQECIFLYDRIPTHCVIVVDEAPIHAKEYDLHSGTYVLHFLLSKGCKILDHVYQAVFLKT